MASTNKFFKGQFSVCLAYYDTRRGQAEGQEADKILGFFPPTAPATMQSSIVGLSQALTMFAGTFNKECPFHHMEAENNLWCMYHCEPDLWLLLVVSKTWTGSTTSQKSMQSYLRVLHSIMVLMHGTLTHQLEQDVSAHWVRKRLQPFLQEAAARLLRPETTELAPLSCPLGMTEGIPILPTSTSAFTSEYAARLAGFWGHCRQQKRQDVWFTAMDHSAWPCMAVTLLCMTALPVYLSPPCLASCRPCTPWSKVVRALLAYLKHSGSMLFCRCTQSCRHKYTGCL